MKSEKLKVLENQKWRVLGVGFAVIVLAVLVAPHRDDAAKTQELDRVIAAVGRQAADGQWEVVREHQVWRRAWKRSWAELTKEVRVGPRFRADAFTNELAQQLHYRKAELVRREHQLQQGVRKHTFEIAYRGTPIVHLIIRVAPEARAARLPLPGRPAGREATGGQAQPLPAQVTQARVAIVLDDWGYNRKQLALLKEIPQPLTVAVLPHTRFAKEVAELAKRDGNDVILHLPMEPHAAGEAREPGTITTAMDPQKIRKELSRALAMVPGAVGVSNHQGSKATESEPLMETVLRELKTRRLFFLDSLSTPQSVGGSLSQRLGVSFVERDVFLDNENDPAYIRHQCEALIRLAKKRGYAIGVGHDRPTTLNVLKEVLPQYEGQGVQFVRVSDLVQHAE